MTYVSEMTEGQTLCHAGSCDKAEDCRSGIGMTPDGHLPVTLVVSSQEVVRGDRSAFYLKKVSKTSLFDVILGVIILVQCMWSV